MVIGQREVDHRADRDGLATLAIRDDDWPLHHSAGTQNSYLRLVDDRGIEERAPATRVGNREGSSGEVIRADLVIAGARGHIGNLQSNASNGQGNRVADNRNNETLLRVNGHSQVLDTAEGALD